MPKLTPITVELGPESLAAIKELTEALRANGPVKIDAKPVGNPNGVSPFEPFVPKYAQGGYVNGSPDGILVNPIDNGYVIPKSAVKNTDALKALLNEGEVVRPGKAVDDIMLAINKKWLEKFNTVNGAVSEVTGYSPEELDEFGGFEEDDK